MRCLWHPKMNQIFMTTGNGLVKVFYDALKSNRGVTLCATKPVKRKTGESFVANSQVLNPHALPMYKQDRVRNLGSMRAKDRRDPVKSHRPELPLTGNTGAGFYFNTKTLFEILLNGLILFLEIKVAELRVMVEHYLHISLRISRYKKYRIQRRIRAKLY